MEDSEELMLLIGNMFKINEIKLTGVSQKQLAEVTIYSLFRRVPLHDLFPLK